MTITPTFLTRAAGLSAVAAGLLFIGVQVGHPYLDATTVTTRRLHGARVRQGADGRPVAHRHHRDVPAPDQADRSPRPRRVRAVRGRVPRRPQRAGDRPRRPADPRHHRAGLRQRRADRRHRGTPTGDVGAIQTLNQVGGIVFLLGGFLFGIALFRAGVLARWAAAVLSVGAVATVLRAVLPGVNFRLFAIPIGVAMIGLGWSLWREQRSAAAGRADDQVTSPRDRAGAR